MERSKTKIEPYITASWNMFDYLQPLLDELKRMGNTVLSKEGYDQSGEAHIYMSQPFKLNALQQRFDFHQGIILKENLIHDKHTAIQICCTETR